MIVAKTYYYARCNDCGVAITDIAVRAADVHHHVRAAGGVTLFNPPNENGLDRHYCKTCRTKARRP